MEGKGLENRLEEQDEMQIRK